MDSISNIVEKRFEKENVSQEVHTEVKQKAHEDNEKHLESNIDTDLDEPCSPDNADLVIKESESEGCSSDYEVVAETPASFKPNEINKPSLPVIGPVGADSTGGVGENTDIESKDRAKEDLSISTEPSDEKTPFVSEENSKLDIIDDSQICASDSNSEKVFVPQDASNLIITREEDKITGEDVLLDCTETLTEKDPNVPTTISSEQDAENTKTETVSPIEPVNKLDDLGKNSIENEEAKPSQERNEAEGDKHRLPNQVNKLDDLGKNSIENEEAKPSQERNEAEGDKHRLPNQSDLNNQILDIISDIDINIKAQEKITQLKEQELKLIQKQNELVNQINQQQILAQQLMDQNQFKQSQCLTIKPESQGHQQNDRDIPASTLYQNNTSCKEPKNVSRTVDLRKIYTPATDTTEILPKNRKLYASSAFYSPILHPTVEDQVELARRISHSLSDISNQTSKGQSMYVNRKNRSDKWVHEGRSQDYQQYQQKPAISPNILPAYSDAGKHRVQLNIHQNQLIEKYSKPGVQVVQSPWEAALQTGSASSAFMEDINNQSFSPDVISPIPYFQRGSKDLKDAVEPAHHSPQNEYTNAIASSQQSNNVPSNPQRDLAYTPSVAQGWGGRNVELPKGLYVPKEISLSSYAVPPQQCAGHKQHFESPSYSSLRSSPRPNFSSNTSLVGKNSIAHFPSSRPLATGFGGVPPNQQIYSPSSYQKLPTASENVAPQVNFSPSPLSSDKLALYETPDRRNLTSASPQYLNVRQKLHVDNASAKPFGVALNKQTTGSRSLIGSIGSPTRQLLPDGSPRCGPLRSSPASPLLSQGQSFNKCARGWGAIPDNQLTYQSQYSLPLDGNLPYSDF